MRGPDVPATKRSRALRRNHTDAEAKLWHHLRDRRLAGHKFRRQFPIGPYFADFVCVEKQLIIELDGGQHAGQLAQDARRTVFLREQGYAVLRFWNDQMLREAEAVLEEILRGLRGKDAPHPGPLPAGGEREDS